MPPNTGRVVLAFEDDTALLARTPAPTCEVIITRVEYAFGSPAPIAAIAISGIAFCAPRVALPVPRLPPIDAPAGEVVATVTGNKWSAELPLDGAAVHQGDVIDVTATAAGSACDSADVRRCVLSAP